MKKFLKFIAVFLLLSGCVIGVYYALSYQRSEEFLRRLTGEGEGTKQTADINPRTPEMSFSYTPPEVRPPGCDGENEDYEARGIVFCYFKEQGNSFWLPCESFVPGTNGVYVMSEDGVFEEVEAQYCMPDEERRQVGIKAEYMTSLADGDYYFVRTGTDKMGQQSSMRYAVHVETDLTFTSTQSGIATKGDYRGEQYFDKQAPEDIVIHLYNIGLNKIARVYNQDDRFNTLYDAEYRLEEDGNTVVISKDYLKSLSTMTVYRFILMREDGSRLEESVHVVITDGEIPRPVISVPRAYSRSSGEDFVMDISMDSEKVTLLSVIMVFYDENGIEQDNLDIKNYLKDGRLAVPAEAILPYARTDAGVSVEYKLGDYYTGNWYDFRFTE